MGTHTVVELLLILLIVASLIAMVTRRLKIPYTVALVIGGLLIGVSHIPVLEHLLGEGGTDWLTKDLVFLVFLPGLLFEAGINIRFRSLVSNFAPILMVAVFGVLIATLVSGWLVHLTVGLALMPALVFGALIAATDPISVLALFKQLGVSKRLSVIVEGESLFNDGTAVVLFQILVVGVATNELDVGAGVLQFLFVAIGGAAVGAVLGYVVSRVTQQIDDPQVEITLTTILAYGSFLLAEELHVSGVIATVAAGLIIGNFGAEVGMSSRTRVALWSFWEYVGFVLNSLIFLLIGLQVHLFDLADYAVPILIAIGVVLLARIVAVYSLTPIANRFTEPISLAWQHVMTWGGIHGGVSIALALSLPADFPERQLIFAMTFGVVAFSIIVQGLTIAPLLPLIGVKTGEEDEYDRTKVRQLAVASALSQLDKLRGDHVVSPSTYDRLHAELLSRREALDEQVQQQHVDHAGRLEQEEQHARAALLRAEKAAIQKAVTSGLVSQHTAEEMAAKADEEIDSLGGAGGH